MALTAKFIADFTSFYDAVQKATVKVRDLHDEANKATGGFNKMVDSLSGDKLRQQATLMVRAVEEVGGASKLTDAEMKRINATMTETIAKMQKMGIEAPKSFTDLQKATEGANKATFDWKSTLMSAAGVVGVAFSANALKNFALDVIATAGTIGDMAEKLGISAEAVQRFSYAAEQSGATIETVDSAIKKMNANLSEGSKSTKEALHAAGLEFDAIRKMAPEQAFTAIGDAIARIPDPMTRSQVALEVFGKAGQELLPTFLAGIKAIGDETVVMTDDTIARLKAAEDMWRKAFNTVKVYGGEAIAVLAQVGEAWQRNAKLFAEAANPIVAIRKGIREMDLTANAAAQSASDLGAMVATIPAPAMATAAALKPVGMNAAQAAATIDVMNASLTKTSPAMLAAAEAARRWEVVIERDRHEAYLLGESAVAASQNVAGFTIRMSEAVQINRDFSAVLTESTIKADSFGHVLSTNVMPSLQGIGNATHQAGLRMQETATKQQFLNARTDDITGILGGIQTGWAQMATVGAKSIQGITNDLISGNWVGAITKATVALSGFIGKLFSASEESKKVSPMRDEFFRLQGGLERLNPRVQELEGNLSAVQAVFDAKTVQQYDAAIANLNRILEKDKTAMDNATDSADDYAATLKKIPSKVPIEFRYSESGDKPSGAEIPGFATGTGGRFVDFGAGTLAMLHGREAIVPESAVAKATGGAGALGGSVTINVNAQGAFFDTPGDLQRLADKVNDALTAKYGLTNRARAA
jgi:DNA-binding phage protein